ncbi:acetate--CoA ligase family protein [Candidatus Woesearchaeota archaeon]|nr:acetate--CoA ligase family protein [Candidatus Woesearchaeota archaeon]
MKKGVYTEDLSEDFLKKYVPVASHLVTKDYKKIVDFSKKVKFPVVLKIVSPQAIHKSDIGGVKIVEKEEELEKSYEELIRVVKKRKLTLKGILAQKFVEGTQLIIGLKKDPSFGHVIMFGLGGIYTEILKDVSFRVCPITDEDAGAMINELKSKQIILGARGQKPLNIKILKEVLVKASKIPLRNLNLEELDINPFVLNSKDGCVVDARMVFD